MAVAPPNVILASGTLQYIQEPTQILKSLIRTDTDYIVIDRTPFSVNGTELISVQSVPSGITRSSYPIRLFNEIQFQEQFLEYYDEIAFFNTVDGQLGRGALKAIFKGFVFKKKKLD